MIRGYRNEIWKDLVFDFNLHEKEKWKISNYGRVQKLKDGVFVVANQYLTNGYRSINPLREDKRRITRYVHKLTAQHFLIPKEGQDKVIHLDYDKNNNRIENLRWATQAETYDHQTRNPVFIEAVKNKRVEYKLDEAKVKIIKRKLNSTKSKTRLKVIARQFGVSDMQIHRIKTGENWGHVTLDD